MLALLLELKKASNFGLRVSFQPSFTSSNEIRLGVTGALQDEGSSIERGREAEAAGEEWTGNGCAVEGGWSKVALTLRASSAVSGSSAGGRPQSASGIGAGCVTVRKTTSGSIPAKGSGDDEADLDLEHEGKRPRELGPVICVGDGEAVRRLLGDLSLPLSLLRLRSLSSCSRSSRERRRSSSLLRLRSRRPRSFRRGEIDRSRIS